MDMYALVHADRSTEAADGPVVWHGARLRQDGGLPARTLCNQPTAGLQVHGSYAQLAGPEGMAQHLTCARCQGKAASA